MFFERLGHWLVRYRAAVLAAMLLAAVAAALSLPRLGFDFGADALLQFSEDEEAFAREVRERFDASDNLVLVVLHRSDDAQTMLSQPGLALLHELTAELEQLDGIDSAFGLTRVPRRELNPAFLLGSPPRNLITETPVTDADVARVRHAVEGSRVLESQLISPDHRTAAIILAVAPQVADPAAFDPVLARIEQATERAVERHATGGARFDIHYGGLPYLRTATVRAMQLEQRLMWPVMLGVYLALLLVVFRRLKPALLPLIAVGAAMLWTMGLMVALDLRMNMLNNAVPILILVVGVTNSIHVMFRIYDEARLLALVGRPAASGPRIFREAVRRGIARVGVASLLTTLTAAIGFAALVTARSRLVGEFGLLTAAGIMLAYLAIIALLPVLLSYVHRGKSLQRAPDDDPTHHGARIARWLPALAAPLCRHPRKVLAAALILLAGSLVLAARMPVDANFLETLEEGHPITRSNALIEAQLGGIMPLDVDLRSEPGAFARADVLQTLADFEEDVAATPGVLSALSIVDVLAETGVGGSPEGAIASDLAVSTAIGLVRAGQPTALDALATPDLGELRVMVRLEARGVQHNLATIRAIEQLADQHFPPDPTGERPTIHARLTGIAYLASVGLGTFVGDLLTSLLSAALVIFAVICIAFRSLRIGLISLLPSLLPLGATLALMPLFDYALNATTVIVFTITLGLAVDNTIHILVRFAEERRAHPGDVHAAIAAALRSSGRAIVLSNLLLVGGFAAMAGSDFMPIRTVAILSIITIVSAMITALVLVPVQLALFGESAFAARDKRRDERTAPEPRPGPERLTPSPLAAPAINPPLVVRK